MVSDRTHVHLVEDDAAVRESLALLLELEGLEVFVYDSAEAFLRASPPNGCVITDLHLPGRSGVDLLQMLGATASSIPVILITAAPPPGLAEKARALGAFRVLEKPFAPSALVEAVHNALAAAAVSSPRRPRT